MSMKPVIVVLEDSSRRVEWLTSTFPEVDVRWCQTVKEFCRTLDGLDDHAVRLLIFDHDLGGTGDDYGGMGGPQWPMDADGNNGLTAAQSIDPRWCTVPAIVWSWNPEGANNIARALQERGIACVKIPFSPSSSSLVHVISSVVVDDV